MINNSIIKNINWFLLFALMLSIWVMFSIKSRVHDANFHYKQIQVHFDEEYKQYNLLKAEMAYLSSPDRISKLSKEFLELDQVKISQLVDNPIKKNGEKSKIFLTKKIDDKSIKTSNSRWRYKKNFNSISTASVKSKE